MPALGIVVCSACRPAMSLGGIASAGARIQMEISHSDSPSSHFGNVIEFVAMKLVGKKALAEFEAPVLAKRRLTLWCKEVSAAKWGSLRDLLEQHPGAHATGGMVRFNFSAQGVYVEALICYSAAVVCIERVGVVEGLSV